MKVKVHYLFSKNEKIGSKFISWGTSHLSNESKTPSHVAILVNKRWVFESTALKGVRVIPYSKWLSINEEVAKVPCREKISYGFIKKIFKSIKGRKYDWLGVTYLGWKIFLNKYFKKPVPVINEWENPNKYFCSEAVAKLSNMNDHAMKAPIDMLSELRK